TELANIDLLLDETLAELESAKQERPHPNGAGNKTAGRKHDLDDIIRTGEGGHFGGDRSRAVWYVINTLLKQRLSADEIVTLLLDQANGISAHIYDQSNPEQYARKQVEKAQKEQSAASADDAEIEQLSKLTAVQYERERKSAAERLKVRAPILDKLVEA